MNIFIATAISIFLLFELFCASDKLILNWPTKNSILNVLIGPFIIIVSGICLILIGTIFASPLILILVSIFM